MSDELTPSEMARERGVSSQAIYAGIRSGQISARKIVVQRYEFRIPRSELVRLAAAAT
jgi:hypothetical protein